MRTIRPSLLLLAAGAVLALPSRAAVLTTGWPEAPGDGLRAATLPSGETAADLGIEPGRGGDLFLAWTESSGNLLRVQRVTDAGTSAYGGGGTIVRSGAGLGIAPAASRRAGDARGRFDLFSTTDGGVLVVWTEISILGRDLRVQRLGPTGSAVFAAGGVALLTELSTDGNDAAAASDGNDGVLVAGVFGTGGQGIARFNRVRSNGTPDYPTPGLALDLASEPKEGPAVAPFPGGEAGVAWLRGDGNGLRFQVIASSGPRLASGGIALGGDSFDGGFPSLRAAGSTLPGSMLVALPYGGTKVHVRLVSALGTLQRNEEAGSTDFPNVPEITASNAIVSGLPEGIEVKARDADGSGAAVRFVRDTTGTWRAAEAVASPVDPAEDGAGALAGPGWVFDLGTSGTSPAGRVAAYRQTAADPVTLDPTLGPWIAVAPGGAPFLRVADAGARVFSAWSGSFGGLPVVLVARAGAMGGQDILDARGLALKSLTVKRPATGIGSLKAAAPEAVLSAERDPESGLALPPSSFRARAGSERGSLADLDLVAWKGGRAGNWKATVAGGGVTGTVKAGFLGRNLKVSLKGLSTQAAERVGWVRVELDDEALAATVPLSPKGKTGAKGVYKAP